jgi:ABC-type antimicrobial peptide transport system permease subunit
MMRPQIKAEIVGVVGDVRTDPESEFAPAMYVPALQRPRNHMYLFARGSGMTAEVARSIVRSVDPTIPVYAFTTGDRLVASRSKSPQFHMTLIGLLAFMALSLSLLGLYGVLSRLVSERTAEIGVRMALGAEPGRVLRMFLSKAMVLLTVGLVAGMAASLALAQVLRSQLHGVTPADPSTYLSVAALMLAVALVAAYVPSKRATSIDPADALRQQ